PVGAIFLIAVLYILLPPNDITITHHEHRDAEYTDDIIISTDSTRTKKFEQKIASRRLILKIKDILRHPVKYYISHYAVSAVFGSILLAVSFILWINGTIQKIFPVFTNEVAVCIMIIALLLPVMAAYELRNRYATAIEKQFPDFLRDLADMRDIGMTLQGAMTQIAGSKTGVLSTEVSLVSREIQYGSSVSGALVRMEERIGLVTVKRAISLLVKASEITEHIREILTIAVSDMEHYLKMKHTRFNVSFVYVAIIYLSFGIFLFTAYAMNVMFIESFSTFNITFDTMQSRNQMFIIGIILASFSGIMAGQLSANSILAGCKHSIIMLIMTVVTFIYLI
ncbi:MAG: type II secretion system F family protein, partial [Methanocorpusculum sp.]|nr:type II secretion system F family protein [Methanocorpusculum sp.]